jgi:hypothetical protein
MQDRFIYPQICFFLGGGIQSRPKGYHNLRVACNCATQICCGFKLGSRGLRVCTVWKPVCEDTIHMWSKLVWTRQRWQLGLVWSCCGNTFFRCLVCSACIETFLTTKTARWQVISFTCVLACDWPKHLDLETVLDMTLWNTRMAFPQCAYDGDTSGFAGWSPRTCKSHKETSTRKEAKGDADACEQDEAHFRAPEEVDRKESRPSVGNAHEAQGAYFGSRKSGISGTWLI